ncbi:MAG: hypothetical protein ACR2NZ_01850 [Rubripirellula sp.]
MAECFAVSNDVASVGGMTGQAGDVSGQVNEVARQANHLRRGVTRHNRSQVTTSSPVLDAVRERNRSAKASASVSSSGRQQMKQAANHANQSQDHHACTSER